MAENMKLMFIGDISDKELAEWVTNEKSNLWFIGLMALALVGVIILSLISPPFGMPIFWLGFLQGMLWVTVGVSFSDLNRKARYLGKIEYELELRAYRRRFEKRGNVKKPMARNRKNKYA